MKHTCRSAVAGLLALMLTPSLAGCGGSAPSASTPAPAPVQTAAPAPVATPAPVETPAAETPAPTEPASGGALYITLGDGEYTTYPYSGEDTPEGLIQGIQALTGWSLPFSEITTGKGGITVVFDGDASMFTAPPSPQKDAFHVFDMESLILATLGSVSETLRHWASPTRPETVDVFFDVTGNREAYLDYGNVGVIWPIEMPYTHEGMMDALAHAWDVPAGEDALLYIIIGSGEPTTYPTNADSPEALLAAMEALTGWDLTLADSITVGKGGMTVSFAPEACLFTGPPMEQKDEFHVYDPEDLTVSVLNSIQATLQHWESPTDPGSVDVYFCMAGDKPLTLDMLGITLPMDQPYSQDALAKLLNH